MHSRGKKLKRASVLLVFLLMFGSGCRTKESPKTAVARIDGQTLTLEEIRSHFDTAQGISEVHLQQYIQRWLVDELLYREAVRRGLDRSDDISHRLEDIRRQLAISALLDHEIYTEQTAKSSEKEVGDYYEAHRNEFVLTQDVALMSYVLFNDRDAATSFRNSVLRGTSWNQALNKVLTSSQQPQSVVARADSVYDTQASLQPSELWRVASNGSKDPSFPVSTRNGYYVLAVWKFAKQGQVGDLHFVEGDIRDRLAIDRRKRAYESMLENLRARYSVEVFTTSLSSDTTALKGVE